MKLQKPAKWEARIWNYVTPKLKSSEAMILLSMVRNVLKAEEKAWLRGERCHACGRPMKAYGLSDMCGECWEEG